MKNLILVFGATSFLMLTGCSMASVNDINADKQGASAANVEVQRIEGSGDYKAEKWIDKTNGIVCYSAQAGGAAGMGISCLKPNAATEK